MCASGKFEDGCEGLGSKTVFASRMRENAQIEARGSHGLCLTGWKTHQQRFPMGGPVC